MAASVTPSMASTSSTAAYTLLAGSIRVEVCSPASSTGTGTQALTGRGAPEARSSTRLRTARSLVSMWSSWGAIR